MVEVVNTVSSSEKLNRLCLDAQYESSGCNTMASYDDFIYPAVGEGGRYLKLFKILQTNTCEGNCFYCANRKARNFPRYLLKPEELANIFMQYLKKGKVQGLFLSSGIFKNADSTQASLIQTLKILRQKFRYLGYIHCKIMPAVSNQLIYETAKFADRLSINLEAPKDKFLIRLSPNKDFLLDIFEKLKTISQINRLHHLKSGISTQIIVGAGQETDKDILDCSFRLYKDYYLSRVYYSGFWPVRNTPLENKKPCADWRQLRLYQADVLLRKYGFKAEELVFDNNNNLTDLDPKLAWAMANQDKFPLDINKAEREEILRIPGIGHVSVEKILQARITRRIKDLVDLKKIGIKNINKTKEFISF